MREGVWWVLLQGQPEIPQGWMLPNSDSWNISAPSHTQYNTISHHLHLLYLSGWVCEDKMKEWQARLRKNGHCFPLYSTDIVFRQCSVSFGYFPLFPPVFSRGESSPQAITLPWIWTGVSDECKTEFLYTLSDVRPWHKNVSHCPSISDVSISICERVRS